VDKDRETFQALVDEHGTTVLAMLRRLCGNPHDADDLFQDVAVRVWRNLRSRPILRNARAWLFTIAYRAYIDHQADRQCHAALRDKDEAFARGGSDRDPVAIAERAERAQLVNSAVGELGGYGAFAPTALGDPVALHGRTLAPRGRFHHGCFRRNGQEPPQRRPETASEATAMRCDDVLAALATRGLFGRWRARWHAARCPRCATAINDFEYLLGELSAVPALTTTERQLWLRACNDFPLANSVRPRCLRPAFAVAVAALLLLPAGIWLKSRSAPVKIPPPVVVVVDTEVAKASSLRKVEEIRAGVVALVRELDQLQREADLLDSRRDADALELQFTPRTAFNGF
jgi:RNA polymerase sigma-70 factor, ECF subfamily